MQLPAQSFITTVDLRIPTRTQINEASAETETRSVIVEPKISKCLT